MSEPGVSIRGFYWTGRIIRPDVSSIGFDPCLTKARIWILNGSGDLWLQWLILLWLCGDWRILHPETEPGVSNGGFYWTGR